MTGRHLYRAPTLYVAIFYGLLSVWTIICVGLLNSIWDRWGSAGALQLFMIAFILFYTWYFSLAISYKIELADDGSIELTSFRRVIKTNAEEIPLVEGPHFAIGFIRFRLAREKAYLFCIVNNEILREILWTLRQVNPDMKFKGL